MYKRDCRIENTELHSNELLDRRKYESTLITTLDIHLWGFECCRNHTDSPWPCVCDSARRCDPHRDRHSRVHCELKKSHTDMGKQSNILQRANAHSVERDVLVDLDGPYHWSRTLSDCASRLQQEGSPAAGPLRELMSTKRSDFEYTVQVADVGSPMATRLLKAERNVTCKTRH